MGWKNKNNSMNVNQDSYYDIYTQLKLLALNSFQWEGLPDSVDERFLELCLYETGYCLYFNDAMADRNVVAKCTLSGRQDIYNISTVRRAYAQGGYNHRRTSKDSVIIFNNYLHLPTDLAIRQFANRIYNIERTIDINVHGLRTPVIIAANEAQRLSMKNLYMQYEGFEPFINVDKKIDLSDVQVIDLKVPFHADKLEELRNKKWNEALTFCGIENSNNDKKERMVTDEVGSNYGNVEAQRNVMLNTRRIAARQISELFDKQITVKFRSDLQTMLNNPNLPDSKETEDNVIE